MQWLIDLFLKLFGMWLNKTPTPIAEAEKAGAAEQQVQDQENADAKVIQAVNAANSVRNTVSTDDGLRKYEAADPNNRDNH